MAQKCQTASNSMSSIKTAAPQKQPSHSQSSKAKSPERRHLQPRRELPELRGKEATWWGWKWWNTAGWKMEMIETGDFSDDLNIFKHQITMRNSDLSPMKIPIQWPMIQMDVSQKISKYVYPQMAMSITNVLMPRPRSSSLSRVHCIDQAIGATPKLSWTWYLFPPVTSTPTVCHSSLFFNHLRLGIKMEGVKPFWSRGISQLPWKTKRRVLAVSFVGSSAFFNKRRTDAIAFQALGISIKHTDAFDL